MKFLGTCCLVLLISCACFGDLYSQSDSAAPKEPMLLDSFGKIPNGDMRGRTDVFLAELASNPQSKGLVVNYGSFDELRARERYFASHFNFRRFEVSRIEVKVGGSISELRTDFWIIPKEAKQPEIKPEAYVAVEFEKVKGVGAAYELFDRFFSKARKEESSEAYVINYGTSKQITIRERWLRNYMGSSRHIFHDRRLTIMNGGGGISRTVMWIVLPGAERPTP